MADRLKHNSPKLQQWTGLRVMITGGLCVLALFLVGLTAAGTVKAKGIVSHVTSAPVFPNGIVKNIRSGINVFLQTDAKPGDLFLDPEVPGYGIPPDGWMEVEMVSGYRRDPKIPLDDRAILLVTGTPQQGLPAEQSGFLVKQGKNENTFLIEPTVQDGLRPENLISPAPGAAFDPIRQRGIKIVHVGRVSAFISSGEKGVVAVRFYDSGGNIVVQGEGEVAFLGEPAPQVFPTNIPHDQRNHNWQRLGVNQIVGVASNTLPIPVILYDRNEGLGNTGIENAGVLSRLQLDELGFEVPGELNFYNGGLILHDANADGRLHPNRDTIIGGIVLEVPNGATGYQVLTPLVSERPFLSTHTSRFNERAGANIGGAIMQVVFIAGDVPGLYRIGFSMLDKPGDFSSATEPRFSYVVVVE